MLPKSVILFWALFTSLSTLGLLVYAGKSLEKSQVKSAFLTSLVSYLFFSFPLLAVFLQTPSDPYVRFTSQCIHAGGILFVVAIGKFILSIASPKELATWRMRFFEVIYFALFISSFLGLIENGVEVGSRGLAPIPGLLMPYFNVTMVLFSGYILFICGSAYRNTKDVLLYCQLKAIFWTALPAFSMLMITNAIIPGLTGDFSATPSGALWVLLCFSGVGFILAQGKNFLLDHGITRLTTLPEMREPQNRTALRCIVASLCKAAKEPNQPSLSRVSLRSNEGSPIFVSVESGNSKVETRSDKRHTDDSQLPSTSNQIRQWVDAIEEINSLSPLNSLLAFAALNSREKDDALDKLLMTKKEVKLK